MGQVFKCGIKSLTRRKVVVNNPSSKEAERLDAAVSELRITMRGESSIADSSARDILNAQLCMLNDFDYQADLHRFIKKNKVSAEHAVISCTADYAKKLATLESEYLRCRAEDLENVGERLIETLTGNSSSIQLTEPRIVVAESFSPAQLAALDKKLVLGLVARKGSATSHTAILANNYDLPYIVDVDVDKITDGSVLIIDGEKSRVVMNPDPFSVAYVKGKMEEKKELPACAFVNTKMKVYANIASLGDLSEAMKNLADGIGLFRTEFLFMNRKTAPNEEEQFEIYRAALEKSQGKEVIIRTIDVGTDKPVDYLGLPKEANPALGIRGARVSITKPELFRVQLRALLRAADYGNLGIMFPMITSVKEVQAIKEQIKLAAQELEKQKKTYKMPKLGIMIETPAAALCSEELGKEVDFFSIGTNDLTQYTLALDRQNQGMDFFYEPRHEAVYKLIAATIQGAHANGIRVGLCGELGADEKALPRLVELGLDEVSVGVASVVKSRGIVAKAEKELKAAEAAAAEVSVEVVQQDKVLEENKPEESRPEENKPEEDLADDIIAAPVDGRLLEMRDIPDVSFSKGMLGPCFGVYPDSGQICAPAGGKVMNISPTGHAIVLETAKGQQVLVHIGIDTVELQDKPFKVMVQEGQGVQRGELLVEADLEDIRSAGYSPITIVALLKAE